MLTCWRDGRRRLRRASDDYKRKWQTAVDELQRERGEKERALEEAEKTTHVAQVRIEEVKNEVSRKVPELAAGALRKAEEEWKKRISSEISEAHRERDAYISSARQSVLDLERSVGSFKREQGESDAAIRRLEDEVSTLRLENSRLTSMGSSRHGSKETFRSQPPPPSSESYPAPPGPPTEVYASFNEVAANVTMTALQGQLGIMQAQCRMLLEGGGQATGPAQQGGLALHDLNISSGGGEDADESGVEKLFSSPTKSASRARHHASVSFKDDEFSGVSGVGVSFVGNEEEDYELPDLSFGRPGSSKSGYLGNLWKARYSAGKIPMPR